MFKDIGLIREERPGTACTPTFDGSNPPTFPDRPRGRPWRRRYLLYNQCFRNSHLAWKCFVKNKYKKVLLPEMESIIIGISRGGNSHQSETNLKKKTPLKNPPRAPKGVKDLPKKKTPKKG